MEIISFINDSKPSNLSIICITTCKSNSIIILIPKFIKAQGHNCWSPSEERIY